VKASKLWRDSKDKLVAAVWRHRGVQLGTKCKFWGSVPRLRLHGRMTVGKEVQFAGGDERSSILVSKNAVLSIGDFTFINGGTRIDVARGVALGRHCLIGNNVVLQDTNSHGVDEGSSGKIEPIHIGDNVWIARNAILLPGVCVGDHSVVAAGSIVTKSFPEKCLIAGNPARLVRSISASDTFVR